MLTYDNQRQYAMMCLCLTGSVVPKAAAWGLASAALTLIVSFASDATMRGEPMRGDAGWAYSQAYVRDDLFTQPYSHYIISYMLGFLMIFRVHLSYERYWEGLRHLYESINRLLAAADLVVAFDEVAEGDAAIRGYAWRRHMMHLFSLLAGTQLLEIRFTDLELSELVRDSLLTASAHSFLLTPPVRPVFAAVSAAQGARRPTDPRAGSAKGPDVTAAHPSEGGAHTRGRRPLCAPIKGDGPLSGRDPRRRRSGREVAPRDACANV